MNNYYGFPQYAPPMMHRQEVVRVNGRGGVDAYQMVPNCEALLLDTTAPIVWLKTTDGAGYATSTPYLIKPFQPEPQISNADLLARIEKLEGLINDKPDNASSKRKQSNNTEQ